MTDMPVIKFGTAPLLDTGIRWQTTRGVDPAIALLPTTPGFAVAEFKNFGPRSLIIEHADGQFDEWRHLEMLRVAPGPNPFEVFIVAADRRWRWPYKHVVRDYNIRRRTGFTRRGDWQELLQQPAQPVFDYRGYSLKSDDNVWTAVEVIADILNTVDPFADVVIDDDVFLLKQLPIENLMIDDPGPGAVRRALQFIPGADVTIRPDGVVNVINTTTGAEIPLINALRPSFFADEGDIVAVDYSRMRPSAVRVWFTIEAEVRFDFTQIILGSTVPAKFARSMTNVIEQPDFKLGDGEESTAQGTFLDILEWIIAIRAKPKKGGPLVRLNFRLLNQILLPGMGPHSALLNAGKQALTALDANWDSRVNRAMRDYRSLFQLNREWVDRIRVLKAELVSTINRQTGQRGKSPAFSDYCIVPSQKAILRAAARPGRWFWGYNVTSYPGLGEPLMTLQGKNASNVPAPADVSVVDGEQGVIRVSYQTDPYGNQDKVIPGKVRNLPVRTVDPTDIKNGVPIAWNAASADFSKQPQLSQLYQLATVLTCTPTSPNNKRRLYSVLVEPKDVKGIFGPDSPVEQSLQDTNPTLVQDIRVGASVETARVAWDETRSADIEAVFGITPGGGAARQDTQPNLKGLVLNDAPQAALGETAASLPVIARGVAASVWTKWRNRIEGSASARADKPISVVGNMMSVTTSVDQGVIKQVLVLPPAVADIDVFAFLPAATRAVILKTVRPI